MDEKDWERLYLRETDHKKRRKLLQDYGEMFGQDAEAYRLRKALLEARYLQQNDGHIDSFIRGWTNLAFLKDSGNGPFGLGKRRNLKMAASVLEEWKVPSHLGRGGMAEEILYQELFNMTLVYIRLCERDKGYGSILMGVGQISESAKIEKIKKDILETCEIPRRIGLEKEFSVFARAARDALEAYLEETAG